ncbi:hypothetical protein ACJZ2D_003092 [Fusarium nematophilum]
MASQITYLITGANRVIAAVRDPLHETSKALAELPEGAHSHLVIVKLDSSVPTDAVAAVTTLKREHNIKALDVVIANAGINIGGTSIRKTTAANTLEHLSINTIAPILLFQATADLLQECATGNPKFIAITALVGSIAARDNLAALGFPPISSPYGGSKKALNWFVRRLHFEEPWLASFVFHPGLVETNLSAGSVAGTGFSLKDLGAISVDESVAGMTKTIEAVTRDVSGTFQNYDGSSIPW